MIPKTLLEQVVDSQQERLNQMDPGLLRSIPGKTDFPAHALILTGIRRCGKSTVLQQIRRELDHPSLFLNFEDPRLAGFDAGDFNRLQEITTERNISTLFFDEIQNVPQWEQTIRFRLDEGYRIFITGSNASMLSRELGTKLTGRHISKELFPFSYAEFLAFTRQQAGVQSAEEYLHTGGFPEMIRTRSEEILMNIFNDIVIRDIAMRHHVKNVAVLRQLALWLISNTARPVTGNSLKKIFPVGSSSSIMEYLAYFTDACLFWFLPKFSYSLKVSLVNPRKIYACDTGMAWANSVTFSDDLGRLLETLVFLHLRRQTDKLHYFSERGECDFVAFGSGRKPSLVQTCYRIDADNLDRELNGLHEAMDFFAVSEGTIVTFDQRDQFINGDKTVTVLPFHTWATASE